MFLKKMILPLRSSTVLRARLLIAVSQRQYRSLELTSHLKQSRNSPPRNHALCAIFAGILLTEARAESKESLHSGVVSVGESETSDSGHALDSTQQETDSMLSDTPQNGSESEERPAELHPVNGDANPGDSPSNVEYEWQRSRKTKYRRWAPWYEAYADMLRVRDRVTTKPKKQSAETQEQSGVIAEERELLADLHQTTKRKPWYEEYAHILEGSLAGSLIAPDEDVMAHIREQLAGDSTLHSADTLHTSDSGTLHSDNSDSDTLHSEDSGSGKHHVVSGDDSGKHHIVSGDDAVMAATAAVSGDKTEIVSMEETALHLLKLERIRKEASDGGDAEFEEKSGGVEDFYETSALGSVIVKRTDRVEVQRPEYFAQHQSATVAPMRVVEYEFAAALSGVINAYKMAQVPSVFLESDEEFRSQNKFAERCLVENSVEDSRENLRFKVVLKPFAFLERVPILNVLVDIRIVAFEEWAIDWKQKRAECVITNETFRSVFAVDEFCVFTEMADNRSVEIYKSLYVSTFVTIPSIMFWRYKDYSDVYISVIAKLANSHMCGGPHRRPHKKHVPQHSTK